MPEGVRLVFIGQGDAQQSLAFREEHIPTAAATILRDPDRLSYRALQWTRQPWRLFFPAVLRNAVRVLRQGHRQGALQGDPFQNGGLVLVDGEGEIVFLHRQAHPGDSLSSQEEARFRRLLESLGGQESRR